MNISFKSLTFFLVLMAFPLYLIGILPHKDSSFPPALSLLIMAIASSSLSFYKDYPYSLRSTVLIYIYVFMGIIPLITYANNITYWDAPTFSTQDYVIANIAVLVFLVIFVAFDFLFTSKRAIKDSRNRSVEIGVIEVAALFPVVLVLISTYVYVLKLGMAGFDPFTLWSGGRFGEGDFVESTQIQGLLMNWFVTPMVSIVLVFQILTQKKANIVTSYLMVILILSASPLAISRFAFGILYLPIVLLSGFFAIRPAYNLLLLLALLLIFPLLHFVRAPHLLLAGNANFQEYWMSIFYSGDFDSYQSLMLVLKHDVITYGYQSLGPILFFIPRVLWPEKPVGSGDFLSQEIGLSFDNISASLLTESYVNFGWIGILFVPCVLGFAVSKLDSRYWASSFRGNVLLSKVRYLYLIPAFLFIMRGDLLSSISFLIGIMLSIQLIYILTSLTLRTRCKRMIPESLQT